MSNAALTTKKAALAIARAADLIIRSRRTGKLVRRSVRSELTIETSEAALEVNCRIKLTSVKRNAATLAAAAVLVDHCRYAAAKGAGNYVCEHCSRWCKRDSFTECHLSF